MGVADSGQKTESTERKFVMGIDDELKGESEAVQRVRESVLVQQMSLDDVGAVTIHFHAHEDETSHLINSQ